MIKVVWYESWLMTLYWNTITNKQIDRWTYGHVKSIVDFATENDKLNNSCGVIVGFVLDVCDMLLRCLDSHIFISFHENEHERNINATQMCTLNSFFQAQGFYVHIKSMKRTY